MTMTRSGQLSVLSPLKFHYEDKEYDLSTRMCKTVAELYAFFNDLGRRINFVDKEIDAVFRQSVACKRIAKVKCIGPKMAMAVVSAIGKVK